MVIKQKIVQTEADYALALPVQYDCSILHMSQEGSKA